MITLRRLFAALSLFATFWSSALAIPPPPPDPQADESTAAIALLAPFLGTWEAKAQIYGMEGWTGRYVYFTRKVELVGNVILITNGFREGAMGWEELNVVAYDPRSKSYRLFLPGYRHTFQAETREVVPLEHPNVHTL